MLPNSDTEVGHAVTPKCIGSALDKDTYTNKTYFKFKLFKVPGKFIESQTDFFLCNFAHSVIHISSDGDTHKI